MNQETSKAVVLVVGGILVGGGMGYLIAQHRLEALYRKRADIEIQSVKEAYKRRYKEAPYSDPASAVAELISTPAIVIEETVDIEYENIVEVEGYTEEPKQPRTFTALEGEIPRRNERQRSTKVYEEIPVEDLVMPEPDPDNPYLITVDQFMDDYENFDKISIVYYEGDDTLADERDQIIPDVERLVGQANLTKFGHASGDKNIVYIRNERIRADLEVAREEDGYAHMVLGMDERFLQHEEKPHPRKMRDARDTG